MKLVIINENCFYFHRATVTEDEIKDAFTTHSFEVKAFKFFP